MTGGLGPPFAAVGTLAIVFASALLAVAAFHPRRRVAYPSGVLGVGVALVYLVLALRL